MEDWEIQFHWPKLPDCRFVHRLLYALVAEGARYNAGRYSGSYRIVPINPNEEIAQEASIERECTERLANIVNLYADFDPATTEMGINLASTDSPEPIHFTFGFVPTNGPGCRVRLSVIGNDVQTEDRFRSFVDLCAGVFQRVGFPYGSFRSEYDDWLPTTSEAFLQERLRRVAFFSAELADEFGRRRLLSAPSDRTIELDDESAMLVVTATPVEDGERLQDVNEYLDLNG